MSERAEEPWRLLVGDALELLADWPAASVDAIVTDPPYGLSLRGVDWDRPTLPDASSNGGGGARSHGQAFTRWSAAWARHCRRVLKPGGYLLAFGAPRTVHRLATGLEDAGLELRDQLLWLHGSGVPKSKLHGGRASDLKPAYEPIVLARAPLTGTLTANEQRFGTGRLGIDDARSPSADLPSGRWPCNLALTHQPACVKATCAHNCPVRLLDRSRPRVQPSRFFYCAKASRRERDAGCERLEPTRMRIYGSKDTAPRRNTHPTVKPVALMRWLVRLACPPSGLVLDPFAGSGSTGIAALAERRRFVGIEREPAHARIARARLHHHTPTRPPARHTTADGGTVDADPGSGVVSAAQSSGPLERRH